MATRRSSSWYAFLCEGSTSSLPPGTEIPSSMLSQFPEEVRDSRIVTGCMSSMKAVAAMQQATCCTTCCKQRCREKSGKTLGRDTEPVQG